MDYKKIHDSIIERAKTRKLEGYKERHHIIPKCMGGDNSKNNLIDLTAREHFIIHKLLCKRYPPNDKLIYAFWRLCNGKNKTIVCSRDYNQSKLLMIQANHRKTHSILTKNKISNTHKGKITSDETKRKISDSNKGKIPWNKDKQGYNLPALTLEQKIKISTSLKGKQKSQDHKENISKANKGKIPWNKGISHSDETKQKISESIKRRRNLNN